MNKFIVCLLVFLYSTIGFAQINNILGDWNTVDDKTGEVRSMVHIFKATNGKYYGKVAKLYMYAGAICEKCTGADKNTPVEGMLIIREMTPTEDGKGITGKLLDPESGKFYYGTISYDNESGKLKLRGSIDKRGILGRSQYWVRKK